MTTNPKHGEFILPKQMSAGREKKNKEARTLYTIRKLGGGS
jgi:hypothetical protein